MAVPKVKVSCADAANELMASAMERKMRFNLVVSLVVKAENRELWCMYVISFSCSVRMQCAKHPYRPCAYRK